MSRTKGQRAPGYAERRAALLAKLRARLGRQGAMRASWRELAAAAEVGLATLTHYFGKREDIILAVMRDDRERGTEPIAKLATPSGPFAQSVHDAVQHLAAGFRFGGVGEIHALGLVEGLRHEVIGPGFVELILEPGIEAVATRLAHHQRAGEMRDVDLCHAATALIAPVLVAFLHQYELSGSTVRHMEIDQFLRDHVEGFIRGYSSRTQANREPLNS